MVVFEILTPGTWLDYEDRDWTWKIDRQIQMLKGKFFDANLAFNLFASETAQRRAPPGREHWERMGARRMEIRRELEADLGRQPTWADYAALHEEIERRLKREQWRSGIPPNRFERGLAFVYARDFIHSLDIFDKCLRVLSREPGVPAQVEAAATKMAVKFPNLRGVRDSLQHMEDRARGLGRNEVPLNLQPVRNSGVTAGVGILIMDMLNGSRFGATMADGHYGEVDVSATSMTLVQQILQELIDAFKWHGPPQHEPS